MNKKIILTLALFVLIGIFLRVNLKTCMYSWDETVYLQNAEVIGGFKGNNYNEFGSRPPVLPIIFAGLFKLHHDSIVANILLTLIGGLSIVLIYKIAEKMFSWKVGIVAAFILAFNNAHILLSQALLTHVPALFFTLCSVYAIKLGEEKNKIWYFALAAFFAGITIMTRFTYLVIIPLFGINFLLFYKKYDWKKLLVLASAFIATMAPYLYWNYLNFGDFLFAFKNARLITNWAIFDPVSVMPQLVLVLIGSMGLIGMALWISSKIVSKKISKEEIFLVVWAVVFVVSMVTTPPKEVRYFIGSLFGFVSLAALGYVWIFEKLKHKKKWIVPATIVLILAIALITPFTVKTNRPIVERVDCNTSFTEVVDYINTQPMQTVYTHHYFTTFAYYTNKTIVIAPFNKTRFLDVQDDYMNSTGYYVYFKSQHDVWDDFAKPEELDSRFNETKTFGSGWDTIIVFEFTPASDKLAIH